ncbi:MAG: class I SAM-dependent methyltransferase [Chloroflexi bacterium]|nr:class I SAM-dependent methyltransferase [Chloroflexota bacterium]
MKDYLYLHLRDLPYFRAFLRAVEAAYYQDFDLPSPTLDVGCGDGHFASLTFERKIDVGLDPWHGPIHEAKTRDAYNLLVEADGGQMPYPDGCFASAFSNSVLEHIPHVDVVLAETARALQPGAPFVFCVPNERYLSELDIPRRLRALGLNGLAERYTEWFRVMSRVSHADGPETWKARLEGAGFELVRWWHYFSPQAMRVLEWGHYFGAPTLLPHALTGRWIIAPAKWNLRLTQHLVQRYASTEPVEDGVFTFYIARKQP